MRTRPPAFFAAEGLRATSWRAGPGEQFGRHHHAFHKVLWCESGSIVFHLAGREVALEAGDRWDLPAGTTHAATVGPDGVVCWEAPH